MSAGSLVDVLGQLKLENQKLRKLLSPSDTSTTPTGCTRVEHLERQLQRVRNSLDAAVQHRQQQVQELQQLAEECHKSLQVSGAEANSSQKQVPALRTIPKLEAQCAATLRHIQCAVSMQSVLQHAEQEQQEELSEAEARVEELREAVAIINKQLQQARAALLLAKSKRASARQDLATAEQQLASGRTQRAALQRQLLQQCQSLFEELLGVKGQLAGTWEQLHQMCVGMPDYSQEPAEPFWQYWQAALLLQPAGIGAIKQAPCSIDTDSPVPPETAHDCLSGLMQLFNSTTQDQLLQKVHAELQAAASLKHVNVFCKESCVHAAADPR